MNPNIEIKTVLGGEKNKLRRVSRRPQVLWLGATLALTLASTASGQSYRVVKRPDGSGLQGLVLAGRTLYGTASDGGLSWPFRGMVFKVNTDGSGYSVLHSFTDSGDGAAPRGNLILSGATLYGTMSSGFCESYPGGTSYCFGGVFKVNTDGSGFTVLKNFFGGTQGMNPMAGLVLSGTTLYGTTQSGGSGINIPNDFGYGVVFKINTDGSGYTVLRNFDGSGYGPRGDLVLSGTTLYGTAARSGFYGAVFKMNTDGSDYQVLKYFTFSDGCTPCGSLVLSGSTLYGTTESGGNSPNPNAGGVVYKVNTDGSGYQVLQNLNPTNNGFAPEGGLILSGSTLYGTTSVGGNGYYPQTYSWGYGIIFKLNIDGSAFAVLKRFNGDDGWNPDGTMLIVGNTLYGTTRSGVVFSGQCLSITNQPLTQTAEAGCNLELLAGATSFGPGLSYQWLFNGTNALVGATSASLNLTNVQSAQAGFYTVVVTNPVEGAVTSAPAMLSVIPPVGRRVVPALILPSGAGSLLHLEYADNLAVPLWSSLSNVTLGGGPQFYFDLSQPLPGQRFYRAWDTNGSPPSLDASMATQILLAGSVGSSVRIDYVNQFGPTDSWVTLGTVTLTNTVQFYYDLTAFRQPARLYRVVRLP